MAQIQMTEALATQLVQRMAAEYGQQAVSNFALDMMVDALNLELTELKAQVLKKDEVIGSQREQLRALHEEMEKYRRAENPHRAQVMDGADKVKQIKRGGDGTNTDPH